MKKSNLIFLSVLLVITLLSFFIPFLLKHFTKQSSQLTATISLKGKVIHTFALDTVQKTETLVIETGDGGYNTVEISPSQIRIIDSNCPDRICVKHGYVEAQHAPAVCLPHQLIIEVSGSRSSRIDAYPH